MKQQIIEVAAGVIEHGGRILIAQRHAGGHLGLLWEFPGGKREPDETLENCLVRELCEELGIEVVVGRKLVVTVHAYPDRTVKLTFFSCGWKAGQPRALGCQDFRWVKPAEFGLFEFPEADQEILSWLCQRDTVKFHK